ncbi:MAG: hypothetical protein M1813_005474 [Trichoglossum hirsutum]|nr:MAG: hypothetical protein M1813_005474 [Trichoglossum hirsutum]
MATVSVLYNTLPSLGDAEKRFLDREKVFATVRNLLAIDNISQPENVSSLKEYYPERWLPSGEAYEFTTRPTISPPADLMKAFNDLTSHIGVLGLYYINGQDEGKMVEHTEGRKNILNPLTDTDEARAVNHIETAWNLGKGDPVTMACVIVCDSRTSRGGAVHKGTKSHLNQ